MTSLKLRHNLTTEDTEDTAETMPTTHGRKPPPTHAL